MFAFESWMAWGCISLAWKLSAVSRTRGDGCFCGSADPGVVLCVCVYEREREREREWEVRNQAPCTADPEKPRVRGKGRCLIHLQSVRGTNTALFLRIPNKSEPSAGWTFFRARSWALLGGCAMGAAAASGAAAQGPLHPSSGLASALKP